MSFENDLLLNAVTGWGASPTQQSAEQTNGGPGRFIRHMYCDFDQGSGTVTSITLRIQVRDPVDDTWIYHVGQSAPGTNAIVFNAYNLSAAGGTLNKWIAVGANVASENNNGWIMIPATNWRIELAVTGGADSPTPTVITLGFQISSGLA